MALKNRHLVFAKNCSNAHGAFAKGDVARGAFSDQLVADYLAVGILFEAKDTGTPITTKTGSEAEASADVTLTDEGDMPAEQAPEADPAPAPVVLAKVARKR
jgi:hypothetical protein